MTNAQMLERLNDCLKSPNDLIAAFKFQSLRDDLKKDVNDEKLTSDNNDCTATAEIQPSPKSPEGDFV